MAEPDYREFALTLKSYAGVDTEDGYDARPEAVVQYCRLPVARVVDLMGEMLGDFAAIFSGCTAVSNPVTVRRLQDAKPREIYDGLKGVLGSGAFPLAFENGDAQTLFTDLCGTVRGAELVLRVSQCLLWAQGQRDLAPFLYKPGAADGSRADDDEDAGPVSSFLDDDPDEEGEELAGVEDGGNLADKDEDEEEEEYV